MILSNAGTCTQLLSTSSTIFFSSSFQSRIVKLKAAKKPHMRHEELLPTDKGDPYLPSEDDNDDENDDDNYDDDDDENGADDDDDGDNGDGNDDENDDEEDNPAKIDSVNDEDRIGNGEWKLL